ncbi:MAG: transposon-encoded TnpW family protein [Oscillospiraceae bacterium]|nr:transposon-encoded TnpW family protein [Oscillospiraceae bacterium]
MHNKNQTVNIQRVADTSRFNKRIGSIIYEIEINFKKDAKETMDKKIMRLIKNDMEAVS